MVFNCLPSSQVYAKDALKPSYVDARAFLSDGNSGGKPYYLKYYGDIKFGRYSPENNYAIQKDLNHPDHWRFQLNYPDRLSPSGPKYISQKAEVQTPWSYAGPDFNGAIDFGKEWWQSWSFMVEPRSDGKKNSAAWILIGQWHATEDIPYYRKDVTDAALSPPIAINLTADDLFAITTRSDAREEQSASAYPAEVFRYKSRKPLKRGKVYHLVLNGRFGWNNDAKLRAWLDGEQIIDLNNISIGYNDARGPHFSFGIYRGHTMFPDVSTEIVHYWNMEFSYDNLIARIANPRPIVDNGQ